ncbi:ribonuclease HII [Candidatus Saccharibacteria bacterium]|nr:MAG: ribonuclease HII [Candidatus Saccharibacteria bacterium]
MILGIDEVGRGAWAGPLVVGAVVLGCDIDGLTDSKALSKKRREQLYDQIIAGAAGAATGWVSAREIDDIGLAAALRLASRRAVREIQKQHTSFHEIIIDGTVNFLHETPLGEFAATMKKADLLVPAVSAASIVAKVQRDRYMAAQADVYRDHKFSAHVGYGTAAHRAAIARHGVTPLHRLSIAPLRRYADSSAVAPTDEPAQKPPRPTTRTIGDASESAAAAELLRRGHEIVERNWRTKQCEIDIISKKAGAYYFCEVKHRRSDQSGDGLAAITPKKLQQMRRAAALYTHFNNLEDCDLHLLAIATAGETPVVGEVVVVGG